MLETVSIGCLGRGISGFFVSPNFRYENPKIVNFSGVDFRALVVKIFIKNIYGGRVDGEG